MNRLYRSEKDKVLGGVCAGLGDYFNIDTAIVRILFVILAITDGIGCLIYLVLWVILPLQSQVMESSGYSRDEISHRAREMGTEFQNAVRQPHPQAVIYAGVGLIILGIYLLLKSLGIPWLHWFDEKIFFAALLIIGGGFLLWRTLKSRKGE